MRKSRKEKYTFSSQESYLISGFPEERKQENKYSVA
jgi:hypothetical protein